MSLTARHHCAPVLIVHLLVQNLIGQAVNVQPQRQHRAELPKPLQGSWKHSKQERDYATNTIPRITLLLGIGRGVWTYQPSTLQSWGLLAGVGVGWGALCRSPPASKHVKKTRKGAFPVSRQKQEVPPFFSFCTCLEAGRALQTSSALEAVKCKHPLLFPAGVWSCRWCCCLLPSPPFKVLPWFIGQASLGTTGIESCGTLRTKAGIPGYRRK